MYDIAHYSSPHSTGKYSQPNIRKRSHPRNNHNQEKERNPVNMTHRLPLLLATYDSPIGFFDELYLCYKLISLTNNLLYVHSHKNDFQLYLSFQSEGLPRVVRSVVRCPGIMVKKKYFRALIASELKLER